MFEIELTRQAAKVYKNADVITKRALNKCFEELQKGSLNHPNIKRLHGKLNGLFRYRIGHLRVIYKIKEERTIILVLAIGSRGDIYK